MELNKYSCRMFCFKCGSSWFAPILERCFKHPNTKVFGYKYDKLIVIYKEKGKINE